MRVDINPLLLSGHLDTLVSLSLVEEHRFHEGGVDIRTSVDVVVRKKNPRHCQELNPCLPAQSLPLDQVTAWSTNFCTYPTNHN
jgi:hypothetical protein